MIKISFRNEVNKYTDLDGKLLSVYVSLAYVFNQVNILEKKYFYGDKLHRLDGPAIEFKNLNFNQWWINGKESEIYYICG